jgi:DNA repair exonuclease SbcCD ATPase subunit
MKPLRLYINNFMCHDLSFVDFTQFNVALIVGKLENNELYSNGVGKSTVFKALEYVLFNEADINLEDVIRDDQKLCTVTFDFLIDNNEYRVKRKRNRKGTTDLTLWQRLDYNSCAHELSTDSNGNVYLPIEEIDAWKDISGRRTLDTEKELEKIIKLNFKAFRSTIYFMQNDLMGIATATPENRKKILKETLNLNIYSKLEKITKDKSNLIYKNIDKHKILIDNLGDPDVECSELINKINIINDSLSVKQDHVQKLQTKISEINNHINDLNTQNNLLKNKYSFLFQKKDQISNDISKIESTIIICKNKRDNLLKVANKLVDDLKQSKNKFTDLSTNDFSQLDIFQQKISEIKADLVQQNYILQNHLLRLEELKIPIPDNDYCTYCRQPQTQEHKLQCRQKVQQDIIFCNEEIIATKKNICILNKNNNDYQNKLNNLLHLKNQLDRISNDISIKNIEIKEKKILYTEFNNTLNTNNDELRVKKTELNDLNKELSSVNINLINEELEKFNNKLLNLNTDLLSLNKEIAHLSASNAVLQFEIDKKNNDKIKLQELKVALLDLEKQYAIYPSVLQAFSSTGIPTLIIQNVLDDLQIETNNLLGQLKPGLQLHFCVEKKNEKTGEQADTLDIIYFINSKKRHYEQLSGAQKLAVCFSLKLGLSLLLNRILGTDFKMLLLDEIDQSLDKASVDAFVEIINFFKKDFTILIVTHNDRLKDKFTHAICVEQDHQMVSRAKVVSSW